MPKSAFRTSRKEPSKQENQQDFFSPSPSSAFQPEQPFFQSASMDAVQAQLEPDTVQADMMEEEEASAAMEAPEEEEMAAGMAAPEEEPKEEMPT